MDKTRDVGRVKASRFSSTNRQIIKQSGSRTEKVRRLSFVGRVCSNKSDCEIGSILSDGEDDFRSRNSSSSSKRFKLPKKFLGECNTVEHASVPRKLRSAIKKRSPESRRLNHFSNGVELPRNDRMKKSKLKQHEELEGSSGQTTVGPISKDEEEVAETLYALAGMFSDIENKIKIDSDGKSSKGKTLLLPEAENYVPSSNDAEDLKMIYPTSGTVAPPQSSNLEGSGGETAEIQVSKQGTQLELPQRKQETLEFQSYIPKSNHPRVSLFSKSPLASETQTSDFAGLDCSERHLPSSRDAEDLKMIYPTSGTVAPPQSSNLEGSGGETAEIQVSKQGTQLELPQGKQETLEFQSYIPKSNHPTAPLFSKPPLASETRKSNFAGLYCSGRRWGAGLNQPLHDLNMNSGKTKEIDVESVATSRNHHDLQPAIRDNKNYGLALWPGLASTGLHNAAMTGPPVKLSAAKLPAWLGIPRSTSRPCAAGNTILTEMEPTAPAGTKKPWKKCSMHVDICRLIKELQTTDGKVLSPLQRTQLTTHGGLNQGASQASKLHLVFENGSNGVVSPYSVTSSSADKRLNEINNAILLHKRLLEDQQHASISTVTYASQKQSRNFMPLLSGGCGMLAKSVADRPGNGPGQEPSTPLHLFPQNHTTMSVHLPQNHHTSYLDHHSASGTPQRFQIQVPPYLSNSISGQLPSSTSMIFPKQQQQFQQFQQQQHLFLAAQLGAQHKPGESAAAPISNWQNGKHEPPPCIMQYGHQMEVVGPGPRYHPFTLQQQQHQHHQFISSTSLSSPQNMVQRYHHHHRDEGVFRPDSASSLQLLCNEQL